LTSQSNGSARAAKVVQVSDMHLFANTSDALVGMNCEEGLRDVLQLIRSVELPLDAVLCTGDISQDNSLASYQRLETALAELKAPQFWIPGNHDELECMCEALGTTHPCFTRSFCLPGWRIILLNSAVEGEVYGRLSVDELEALDAALGEGDENILVCLHHNPVPVGAHWLQRHALQNPDALFQRLDACPRVRVVLFGHIHHELQRERNGVLYLGTPSTSVQFHPTSFDFALDRQNPGYRWVDLYPDGRFETGVRRVENKSYAVDFSGIGY
jgi:Icc protein